MEISYYGHSSFVFDLGKKVMTDPFITGNELAKDIVDVDAIKADYILLSHGHQDHVLDVERVVQNNPECQIVANFEIVSSFGAKGLKGHPMNTGGKWSFEFGEVKCVNAVHSNTLPDGSYAGSAMGFVVKSDSGKFYFAGDTALTMDMKLIPMICGELDFAILPIGDNFTMGIQDAILASDFIGCDKIVGCHFDTFGYIKIDHQAAVDAFKAKGKELILMDINSTRNI